MSKLLSKKSIKIYLLIVLLISLPFFIKNAFFKPTVLNAIIAQKIYKEPSNTAFKDENFYKCVVDNYNSINNTSIAYTESLTDEQLQTITGLSCSNKEIKDASGLEKLTNLKYLSIYNNQLTNLDISENKGLVSLYAYKNEIVNIDLSENKILKYLYLEDNKLKNLNVKNNTMLEELWISENQIEKVDVKNNVLLTDLRVGGNILTSIDVSKNTALLILSISGNQLTEIDISNNTKLTNLYASSTMFSYLDTSKNLELSDLTASDSQLTSLDLSNNSKLKTLYVHNSKLTNLNVNDAISLESLIVYNNQLTNLDVGNNKNLKTLYAYNNQLVNLNIDGASSLKEVYIQDNKLTSLDVGIMPLERLNVSHNSLTDLNVSEAVNLVYLNAGYNKITSLNISKNTELQDLNLDFNELNYLDVSNNKKITKLWINSNSFMIEDIVYLNTNYYIEPDVVKFSDEQKVTLTSISTFSKKLKYSLNDCTISASDVGKHSFRVYLSHDIQSFNRGFYVDYTINVVQITSDKYKIDNDKSYIYTDIDDSIEQIRQKIKTPEEVNLNISLNNNKLKVLNEEKILKEFDILNINVKDYVLTDNSLFIPNIGKISYADFVKNIEPNGVSYKVFKENDLVTDGNIENGMYLRIYKDEALLKEYIILSDYLDFDKSLNINKDEKYIYNLEEKTKAQDILSKVNTSGIKKIVNRDLKEISSEEIVGTGYKLIIELSTKKIEYLLVVEGDITGDGKVNSTDVGYIANYIIGTEGYELSDIEKIAADITKEGKVNSTDVGYIANYIIGTEGYESLVD